MRAKQRTFKYTLIYTFVAFCVALLVLLVFTNAKIRADSHRLLQESIQAQLIAVCQAAHENIDPDELAIYTPDTARSGDPGHAAVLARLRVIADATGAKYIYVLKEFDGRHHFVLDTDPVEDDSPYDDYKLSPVHEQAFLGIPGAGIMNVQDQWGNFHTGAIPIRNDAEVIAIVCADIDSRIVQRELAIGKANTRMQVVTVLLVALSIGALLWMTQRLRAAQDKLAVMAHYDPVTGLPNRQYLISHLNALAAANDMSPYTLFFTDLDNFKTVNDKAGHDAGDALLKRIGAFLLEAPRLVGKADMRAFRPPAGRLDLTARIGGDEFVLLIPGIENREEAARVAQAILDHFHRSVDDEHVRKYNVGLSIGAALFPAQSENYHEILKYADIAMYHAKRAGKNGYRVYEDEMPDKREK